MTVPVVAQLDQPAELVVRPLAVGQDFFGLRAQRTKQLGNVPVMPADLNVGAGRMGLDFLGQLLKLAVVEPAVILEPERFGKRFESEPRAMAVAGIRSSEQVVQFQRLSVNLVTFEVANVSRRAGIANGRQSVAGVRFFGVPDDQNDGVFWRGECFIRRRLPEHGRRNGQCQQGAKYDLPWQLVFHVVVLGGGFWCRCLNNWVR